MFFVFYTDEKYIPYVHSRPMMAGINSRGQMCWDEPSCDYDNNEKVNDYKYDLNYTKIANGKGKGV
jgi:hypothetical protein